MPVDLISLMESLHNCEISHLYTWNYVFIVKRNNRVKQAIGLR